MLFDVLATMRLEARYNSLDRNPRTIIRIMLHSAEQTIATPFNMVIFIIWDFNKKSNTYIIKRKVFFEKAYTKQAVLPLKKLETQNGVLVMPFNKLQSLFVDTRHTKKISLMPPHNIMLILFSPADRRFFVHCAYRISRMASMQRRCSVPVEMI